MIVSFLYVGQKNSLLAPAIRNRKAREKDSTCCSGYFFYKSTRVNFLRLRQAQEPDATSAKRLEKAHLPRAALGIGNTSWGNNATEKGEPRICCFHLTCPLLLVNFPWRIKYSSVFSHAVLVECTKGVYIPTSRRRVCKRI